MKNSYIYIVNILPKAYMVLQQQPIFPENKKKKIAQSHERFET